MHIYIYMPLIIYNYLYYHREHVAFSIVDTSHKILPSVLEDLILESWYYRHDALFWIYIYIYIYTWCNNWKIWRIEKRNANEDINKYEHCNTDQILIMYAWISSSDVDMTLKNQRRISTNNTKAVWKIVQIRPEGDVGGQKNRENRRRRISFAAILVRLYQSCVYRQGKPRAGNIM